MGKKGAKLSEKATRRCEELVEILKKLGNVNGRKMFGGYGIFYEQAMFALVTSEGGVFFKVAELNRKRFNEKEAKQFGNMPYFELPTDVLVHEKELYKWARDSIAVAQVAKKNKN